MFAIIRTGGKQYKVAANDVILVEKLETSVGSSYTFDSVLMVGNDSETLVGAPFVNGAQVIATVENEQRSDKVIIFKKRRRHTYRRKKGHRQHQTVLRILEIKADGIKPSVAKEVPQEKVAKSEKIADKAVQEKAKKMTKTKVDATPSKASE